MIYTTALAKHFDEQYAHTGGDTATIERKMAAVPTTPDNDELYYEYTQHHIAREVGLRVAQELGELVAFDTFDNCREHGLTVRTPGGWVFCFYEHRNTDSICIEGCREDEVQPYGPYGGETKWDTIADFRYGKYDHAAHTLCALIRATIDAPDVSRAALVTKAREAAAAYAAQ